MSRALTFLILSSVLSLWTGCTKSEPTGTQAEVKSAANQVGEPAIVNLAVWTNYVSPEVQERFTKETGIKINISNYASNEELLAKVQSGASGFDIAVPSDYMVEVMTKLDLLEPLDHAKIPNKGGLGKAVLNQEFDPDNKYSLPYAWGTVGIAIHRDLFKGTIKGWRDLFDNKEISGKLSMLDDVREVMAAALKLNGASVNSTDPEVLKKAQASLKGLRPRVKMFRSDAIDALVNKEVAVAHAYSTDALQAAAKTNGKVEYIVPVEGGTRSIDNLVILKGAKNVKAAHALINYLLSKDSNVAFVQKVFGGPVVAATKAELPKALQSNSSLFPAKETLSKLERIKDVGEANSLYERMWTELKME